MFSHQFKFLVAFGSLALAPALHAEPSAHSLPADTVTALGELNVVALKQSDKLRDDPVAATVIGLPLLESSNTTAIKGIADIVPNLYIPDYGSRITSTIYVRGIGARMDQPAVGLNVDNVPFLHKNAYDFEMADIASVEMMRGPQSTLYGRNTIAGLIDVQTLSPMRWQGWRISLQAAGGKDFKASAGWYHKFSSVFASSITVAGSYLGGFYENDLTGSKVDHEKNIALRWKTEWRLSKDFHLINSLSTSLLDQGGYPYKYMGTGQIAYNDPCFYKRKLFNDGLTLRWRAPAFTLSSVTSLQWLGDNMTLDQDFLPEPFFTITQRQHDISLTEDILFRGRGEGIYSWKGGVFAFWRRTGMRAPVTFKDQGIKQLIEDHRNDANPYYPITWDTRSFLLGSHFTLPSRGVALYHESELELGRFRLSAGIRADYEVSGLDNHSFTDTGYTIYKFGPGETLTPDRHVAIEIDDRGSLNKHYINWLPKVTLMYSLPMMGENNLYLNIAKGFKAGGYNTQMFSDVLQQRLMGVMGIGAKYDIDDVVGYRPEFSWNYELGAHLFWPGANLESDLALFFIDVRDQQLTMFPDGTTTGRIMTNAGRTRSMGAEVSLTWRPTDRWDFMTTYGLTDARFRKFYNGKNDFAGKFLPYVPRNTLFIQAGHSLPLHFKSLKALEFDINLRGTGSVYWNEENSVRQPFYVLAGASATLRAKEWSLQIWGRNITDSHYDTFYFKSMGNEFLQQGRPFQLGITFRLQIEGK